MPQQEAPGTPQDLIKAEAVGAWYDKFGDLYHMTLGDSVHCGLWVSPDEPHPASLDLVALSSRAQDRYTDYLIRLMNARPGGRHLDIGCGPGRPAACLAEQTGTRVTGISVSKEQIARAQEMARATGLADRLAFEVVDAMNLPYEDESFDTAWAVESLCHMDRAKALGEAWRVLRPGGHLMILESSLEAELTPEELGLYETVLASNPPLTFPQLSALLERTGFRTLEFKDLSANLAISSDIIALLLRDRREELTAALGAEFVEMTDAAYTGVRTIIREKTRFFMMLLSKPLA
ncbi:SAM-dependent methyltransferase [Streptomyces abikoensis]|uniref:SAM-dependent methyltransferase n=1 Tax=Streptomyces abikoensis TaxID=97398 RepID=UPI00368B1973